MYYILMRRLEQDKEEQQEIDEAIKRQATPTHDQPTEEFDSLSVRLPEFGRPFSLTEIPSLPDNQFKKS